MTPVGWPLVTFLPLQLLAHAGEQVECMAASCIVGASEACVALAHAAMSEAQSHFFAFKGPLVVSVLQVEAQVYRGDIKSCPL